VYIRVIIILAMLNPPGFRREETGFGEARGPHESVRSRRAAATAATAADPAADRAPHSFESKSHRKQSTPQIPLREFQVRRMPEFFMEFHGISWNVMEFLVVLSSIPRSHLTGLNKEKLLGQSPTM